MDHKNLIGHVRETPRTWAAAAASITSRHAKRQTPITGKSSSPFTNTEDELWKDWRVLAGGVAATVVISYTLLRMVIDIIGLFHSHTEPAINDPVEANRIKVEAFTNHCTKLWLTNSPDLDQCITIPENVKQSESTNQPDILSIQTIEAKLLHTLPGQSSVTIWTVTCAAEIQRYNSTEETQFITWNIGLTRKAGPRAVALPFVRGTQQPHGYDISHIYTHEISEKSPVYDVVSNFFVNYLTESPHETNPWIVPHSGLTGLGALYTATHIVSISATTIPAKDPKKNDTIKILATITADTEGGDPIPMQYPLTLTAPTDGKWLVSGIDNQLRLGTRITAPKKNK